MSFIEVTLSSGVPATLAVEHIVSMKPEVVKVADKTGRITSSTHMVVSTGGILYVKESYEEVRRLIGLDWLHCGETHQGDICDRRIDSEGRCPIHGMVGA